MEIVSGRFLMDNKGKGLCGCIAKNKDMAYDFILELGTRNSVKCDLDCYISVRNRPKTMIQ